MSSIVLPTVYGDGGLAAYLREVRAFPILTVEEEISLARRLRDAGDRDAAHTLVTSHLKLVVKIARQYRKFSLPFEDLISEGTVGLMKAVRKFDPEKGYRLSTYALWWIKAEITEFVLKSWSMVRIGSITVQKKLFYNLHRAKARLRNFDAGIAESDLDQQLADEIGVSLDDVRYLGTRLEQGDVSLDQPASDHIDGVGDTHLDRLVSDADNPEQVAMAADNSDYQRFLIDQALSELPERDRDIIRARRLSDDGATLEELGERFGVSRERIRQIEERALKKIKAGICAQLGIEAQDGAALERLPLS